MMFQKIIFRVFGLVLLFAMLSQGLSAQREMTLGIMPNLYQSTYINPANLSEFKIHIGLPGISSNAVQVHNSGFAYKDGVERRPGNDTTYLNISRLINAMSRTNFVYAGVEIDLFSFAYRRKKSVYGFHIREHVNTRFSYPKNLFRLAWEGNQPFVGDEFSLGGLAIDATHFREFAFLVSKPITKELRIGARAKYLVGLADINTQRSQLFFNTNEDPYELELKANYRINTSGPFAQLLDENPDEKFNPINYALNRQNWGLGLDIGAFYDFNKDIQFSASIINLGFINWKSNVTNYDVNGTYIFDGIDGSGFFSGDFDFDPQEAIDSLINTFQPTESNEAYTSFFSPQIYLGGHYSLSPNTTASVILNGEYYRGFRPGVALGVHQRVGRIINLAMTYSMQSRRFNNLGFGFMLRPGPIQFYLMGDNFQSLLEPRSAKLFNLRLGFNLAMGGKKKDSIRLPKNPS